MAGAVARCMRTGVLSEAPLNEMGAMMAESMMFVGLRCVERGLA